MGMSNTQQPEPEIVQKNSKQQHSSLLFSSPMANVSEYGSIFFTIPLFSSSPTPVSNILPHSSIYFYFFFFTTLALFFVTLLWFSAKPNKKTHNPTNWPLLGMLPALARNIHRIHDFVTDVLIESGGTFEFRGPLFCNVDMVVTCDPVNIHHIFSRNFNNYPKGPEFKKIFDVLGDGIFNSDFELWKLHRRTTHAILAHPKYHSVLERTIWAKVETGLLPVLEHCVKQGGEVDLLDVLERFGYDIISKILLSHDPCSLSADFPYIASEKAVGDALESLLHRHILPETVWKLQKWLNIGHEKKLAEAAKAVDNFLYPLLSGTGPPNDDLEIFKTFRQAYEESKTIGFSFDDPLKYMRDTFLGLMVAGRDTSSSVLPWFFSHVARNPEIEARIMYEIREMLDDCKWRVFTVRESRKLVYLHAALSETLRLHPPLSFEHKSPSSADVLPSGNILRPDTKVLFSFYSTGRMESVWGKDCLEFKPERWILAAGGIRHEPSFKFPAFNAGPRTCQGKEMAFYQLKVAAAAIMYHYSMRLEDGRPVVPRASIMLKMKHGFKVKLIKRNDL